MWIDSHCHLDAPEFDADRTAVVQRAAAAGVTHLVLPAVEVAHFETVRRLAHAHGAPTRWASTRCTSAEPPRPTWKPAPGLLAHNATTRAWWPWAKSAWITSCPGWIWRGRHTSTWRSWNWRAPPGCR
jgi:hypothetical protein